MSKYPISKDYGIFRFLKPPVIKAVFPIAAKVLSAPPFLWKDSELDAEERTVKSFDGFPLTVYIISPKGAEKNCPCLVNFHGGGFVFEGAFHHYRLPMNYAKRAGCKVIYVKYRLAPKYKFPIPVEDCFSVLKWVYENAEELGIDPDNIGVGGDSAGGTLSAAVCQMNRDRNTGIPIRFQLLIYPFLDLRNSSISARRYTNTPMWNSELSARVKPLIMPEKAENTHYISPVEAKSFTNLPPAYIETAEFDCLHDDGVLYGELLSNAGVETVIYETKGTMHGYDIALNAPLTKVMIGERSEFMKSMFSKKAALKG